MVKNSKNKFIYTVGRRRESSARVRLYKGGGQNLVNMLLAEKYFPGEVNKVLFEKPFRLTDTLGKYHATVRVVGGGKAGQLEAVVHGIAKALSKEKEEFRKILKKAGLLMRDARVRERRKVGTGGKARRLKQSPKR